MLLEINPQVGTTQAVTAPLPDSLRPICNRFFQGEPPRILVDR